MRAKKAKKQITATKPTILRGTRWATRRQSSRPNRPEVEPCEEDEGDDGMKLSISNACIENGGGVIALVDLVVGIAIYIFWIVL